MDKDELLVKRIQELASAADRKGCLTFSDFLNLNEQNILHDTLQKFSWIKGETFGGYKEAERRMAAFVPSTILWDPVIEGEGAVSPSGLTYPIACIHMRPRSLRFAEKLSHRDVLGALMNLGIERAKTGDIAVDGEEAYIFCSAALVELICRELTQVRRTAVTCSPCNLACFSWTPVTQTVQGSIASVRLDAIMSLGFGISRSSLLSLIEGGSVFVNGKLITTNAYTLKEGDIVSARGLGRFRYVRVTGQTKKGRQMVQLERYV